MRSNSLKQGSAPHSRLHSAHLKKQIKQLPQQQPQPTASQPQQSAPQEVQWLHRILGELKNYQNQGTNTPAQEENKGGSKDNWEDKVRQSGEQKGRGVRKIKIAIIDSKQNRQPAAKTTMASAVKTAPSTKNKPKINRKPLTQSLPKRQRQAEVAQTPSFKNCYQEKSSKVVEVQPSLTDPCPKQPQSPLDSSLWNKDSDILSKNSQNGRQNSAKRSVGRIVRNSPAGRAEHTSTDSVREKVKEEMKADKSYQPKFRSPKHEKRIYLKLETDKLCEYLSLSKDLKKSEEVVQSYKSEIIQGDGLKQTAEEPVDQASFEKQSNQEKEQKDKMQEGLSKLKDAINMQISLKTPTQPQQFQQQLSLQDKIAKSEQRRLNSVVDRRKDDQSSEEKTWSGIKERSSYSMYKQMKCHYASVQSQKQPKIVTESRQNSEPKSIQELKKSYLDSRKMDVIRKKHQKLFTLHQIESQSDRSSPGLAVHQFSKPIVKKQEILEVKSEKESVISTNQPLSHSSMVKSMTEQIQPSKQFEQPLTQRVDKKSVLAEIPILNSLPSLPRDTTSVLNCVFDLLDPQQTGLITSTSCCSENLTQQLRLMFSSVFNQLRTRKKTYSQRQFIQECEKILKVKEELYRQTSSKSVYEVLADEIDTLRKKQPLLFVKHTTTHSKYQTHLSSKRTSLNSTHSFVIDKVAAHEVTAARVPLQQKASQQSLSQDEPQIYLKKKYGLGKGSSSNEGTSDSIEAIAQRTRSYLASLETRFPGPE